MVIRFFLTRYGSINFSPKPCNTEDLKFLCTFQKCATTLRRKTYMMKKTTNDGELSKGLYFTFYTAPGGGGGE